MPAARKPTPFRPRKPEAPAENPYAYDDEHYESKDPDQEVPSLREDYNPFHAQNKRDAVALVVEGARESALKMAKAYNTTSQLLQDAIDSDKNPLPPAKGEELDKLDASHRQNRLNNKAARRMSEFTEDNDIDADLCRQYEPRKQQLLNGKPVEPLGPSDAPQSVAFVKFNKGGLRLVLPFSKSFVCLFGAFKEDELSHELVLALYNLQFAAGASMLAQGHRKPGGYSRFTKRKNESWSYKWYVSLMENKHVMDKMVNVHKVCRRAYLQAFHEEKVAESTRQQREFRAETRAKLKESNDRFTPAGRELLETLMRIDASLQEEEFAERQAEAPLSKGLGQDQKARRKRQRGSLEKAQGQHGDPDETTCKVAGCSQKRQRHGYCLQHLSTRNEG